MRNDKGFTLIELLAVIIILAIIALITTPVVIQIISESSKNTFKSSVEELMNVTQRDYSEYARSGSVTYSLNNNSLTCPVCEKQAVGLVFTPFPPAADDTHYQKVTALIIHVYWHMSIKYSSAQARRHCPALRICRFAPLVRGTWFSRHGIRLLRRRGWLHSFP